MQSYLVVVDQRADDCNLLWVPIYWSLLSVAESEFAGMNYSTPWQSAQLGKHCCPHLEEVLTLAEVTTLKYWEADILKTAGERDSQSDKQEDVTQIDLLA